ncbi:ribonuclease P protein subunit [Sulfurisphaera javensis]|uniref:Ribonuclease P protein component 1 n=1 Tax=Sulfurisphaera javensis TaxID=2049879 RepID=A0AAT9GRJ9_9CREN
MIDLIGTRIKILGHSDPSLIGREGIVIYESRKTFLIQAGSKRIRVLKDNGIFEFYLNGRSIVLPGSKLVGKLEKRWL